ncbi:uncharacterized protein LOC132544582 [Ylistrum balloti]|uniref:uncharacterized protein LOC132544582 n=1 Tax=Ylistrum balloti TaxID=509963 RepID=UPI002905B0E7|nr:uncharacterized protein LOC132544582 [Ylistrum balloti]
MPPILRGIKIHKKTIFPSSSDNSSRIPRLNYRVQPEELRIKGIPKNQSRSPKSVLYSVYLRLKAFHIYKAFERSETIASNIHVSRHLNSTKMSCPTELSNYQDLSSTFKGTAAAFLYGTCSVSMAFINKTLMTTFEFDFPVFIMVMQMLFTICVLELLSILNLIQLPKYTLQRGKMFSLPALFYGVNSILGLNALGYMNVAMYGVLKRCVPLATMFLSVLILKKGFPSRPTIAAVLLITGGCVIASYGDLKFTVYAYTCGALSNLTHSLYLLLVQKVTEKDLSTVETLQLNSFNTLPFLAAYSVFSGEFNEVMQYDQAKNISFMMLFFVTISIGCMLNYSLFLCTSLTSALTTSVVGGVKALTQTVFGMFTFGGISHNMSTYIGITINTMGSIMYLYTKYREGKQRVSMGGALHKVISVSTAEDFKELANGKINGNGNIQYLKEALSPKLHPIKEEYSDHGSTTDSSRPSSLGSSTPTTAKFSSLKRMKRARQDDLEEELLQLEIKRVKMEIELLAMKKEKTRIKIENAKEQQAIIKSQFETIQLYDLHQES